MIKVSFFGKMGDLMYALPVLRALHRLHGEKVHLLLSGSAWQFVPVLWEQPYLGGIELEDTKAHATIPIERGAIFPHWEWYKGDEGINLSLQPRFFVDEAPVPWTHCYMQAAGVQELLESDCMVLPTLVNHRRWLYGIDVVSNGKKQELPKTVILAPETDTLDELFPSTWERLALDLREAGYIPLFAGMRNYGSITGMPDVRGLTSVPVLARLIAEAAGFIGAHSFPWHLARHSETPAICLQTWREGLRRCLPVDTPYTWIDPKEWRQAVPLLVEQMDRMAVPA